MTLFVALYRRLQQMPVGSVIRYRGNRVLRLQQSIYLLNGETQDAARIATRLSAVRDAIDGRVRERRWFDSFTV